ncbi:MAG: EI24 domain-containing protein, partial [Myxococcaceae bacterium]|nr:EI24 domain-containing protein [Myxococcaceae bacterium]
APLADPLSEATETRCGDFESPPFSLQSMLRGTAMSLRHTVLRLVALVGGLLVLAPLHFIPVAGSVLWLITSWAWSAFWLAVEHVSTPAARHLSPLSQVVKALRAHPALALGLGASLWALLWVPLVNVFLLPVAVVAGTLAFRALRAAGHFAR